MKNQGSGEAVSRNSLTAFSSKVFLKANKALKAK
jgi:hypothetical protein